jgi:predicted nucleotidyltransferase
MMVSMGAIAEFSRRIAAEYRPQRIVLFGSYARGTPTPDSDVDLLVIMAFEGKSVHKSVEIRLKLHPRFPLDLLVRTPEAVQRRLDMGDCFMRDVVENGRILYEADNV